MMGATTISIGNLALGYLLLVFPLGIIMWLRIPILGRTLLAVVRMTVQLLFVGFYLQVVFELNSAWINALWLAIMITVADISIVRGCELRLRFFALPLFASLLIGTIVPLLFFLCPVLRCRNIMEAQYVIPIGGMILGNCLRADIIGLRSFYQSIRAKEKVFRNTLAQGAHLHEACRPYLREACQSALAPTVATMSTIGLVSLPGMMTGVILAGENPMTAIKYQIAIMIAIFSGTALTVLLAILLTRRRGFTPYGVLDKRIFIDSSD